MADTKQHPDEDSMDGHAQYLWNKLSAERLSRIKLLITNQFTNEYLLLVIH